METFVILQLLFISIFAGGLSWSRAHVSRKAFLALALTILFLAVLFLVARLPSFSGKAEIITTLSNVWGWFAWCWIVIVILFCETLFRDLPWNWQSVKLLDYQARRKIDHEGEIHGKP